MNVREQLETLGEIAEGQWGMVTTAQAHQHRVTRVHLQRAIESGNLERLAHGIYRITGAPTDLYEHLRTAWIAFEPARTAEERLNDHQPHAVVTGPAAAWLHGLGDLDPVPYDIATTIRTRPRRDDVRATTRHLQPDDITIRHGLPVTTVERTVADLILEDTDFDHLADITIGAPALNFHAVEAYIDNAPVRRRAKARATLRRLPSAVAAAMLSELEKVSAPVRTEILLAARPTLKRLATDLAAIGGQVGTRDDSAALTPQPPQPSERMQSSGSSARGPSQ